MPQKNKKENFLKNPHDVRLTYLRRADSHCNLNNKNIPENK